MTNLPDPSQALAPVQSTGAAALPQIVRRAGQAAVFAEEFFYGAIRNKHTRVAYSRAVNEFLGWGSASLLVGAKSMALDEVDSLKLWKVH